MSLTGKLILGFLFALVLQVTQMAISGHFTAQMQAASLQVSAALSASLATQNAVDAVRRLQARIQSDMEAPRTRMDPAVYRVYLDAVDEQSGDLSPSLGDAVRDGKDDIRSELGNARELLSGLNRAASGSDEDLRAELGFFEDAVGDLEQALLRTQVQVAAAAQDGVRREREVHDLPLRAGLTITLGGVGLMAAFIAWFSRQLVIPIERARAELEGRVAERTATLATTVAELEGEISERMRVEAQKDELHERLVETSRRAGMAELANGVLHNVGNVLNSVNISSNVLLSRLGKTRADGLQRVVALLNEHEHDLVEFLTNTSQGQKVPRYLEHLANHLTQQGESLVDEAIDLSSQIDHMIEIVSRQQSYARVSGTTSVVRPSALVNDVIELHAKSLADHDIRVEQCAEFEGECELDRSRVMQILTNLVSNGRDAIAEHGGGGGILETRVDAPDDEHVRIVVCDNGSGIDEQNLARIFAHGFTTKRDGHGFGLHHSANAASEMGGRLGVESAGTGRGAKFWLELPRRARVTAGEA